MTGTTDRLGLPLIAAGQAQKEMTHNEALALLDVAVQASVARVGVSDPPQAPEDGRCWIVGPAPTGAWTGQAGAIAAWTRSGWRFVPPRVGLTAWSEADGMEVRCDGATWSAGPIVATALHVAGQQVVGPRRAAITEPAGGAIIDTEAREALTAILTALRDHGLIDR